MENGSYMLCMRSNVRRLGWYGDYVFGAGWEEEIKKTHPAWNKSFLNYITEVSLIRNRLGFELLISVIRSVNPLFENTP